MRKGYIHAVEGIIAGLLVIFYLGSMIQPPEPTDWTRTALTQRSGDVLGSMSRADVLDRAVVEDDPRALSAAMDAVGASLDFSMNLRGVPQRRLDVRVGVQPSQVTIEETSPEPSKPPAMPEGVENDYRTGSIHGVDFALSDMSADDAVKYDTAFFDFNDDGSYSDSAVGREGPFQFGDMIRWNTSTQQEPQGWFQVGYINDSLTLYNMSEMSRLVTQPAIQRGGLTVRPFFFAERLETSRVETYSGTNPLLSMSFYGADVDVDIRNENREAWFQEVSGFKGPYLRGESVELFGTFYTIRSIDPLELDPVSPMTGDVLLLNGFDPERVEARNESMKRFLSNGGTLMELTDLSMLSSFEDSFHQELGMRQIDVPLIRGDVQVNRFTDGEPGTPAGFVERFFTEGEITIPEERFSLQPDEFDPRYGIVDVHLGGKVFEFNVSVQGDTIHEISNVGIPFSGFSTDLTVGESVFLANNTYRIVDTYPLRLGVEEGFGFRDLRKGRFAGGSSILGVDSWEWDVGAVSRNLSEADGDLWESGLFPGNPESGCSDSYRNGELSTPDGAISSVNVSMIDIPPCGAFEYITFDFDGDGRFDANVSATGDGYSAEGIHLTGDIVRIDGNRYALRTGGEGAWLQVDRVVPEAVGSVFWNSGAYRGNGNYVYMGNRTLTDDEIGLVTTLFVRAARERFSFTPSRLIGEPNIGSVVTAALNNRVYTPYSIETVWWFG